MKTIRRYELSFTHNQTIVLPTRHARPLHVATELDAAKNEVLALYVELDFWDQKGDIEFEHDNGEPILNVYTVGTGEEFETPYDYVGSIQAYRKTLVFHVYADFNW